LLCYSDRTRREDATGRVRVELILLILSGAISWGVSALLLLAFVHALGRAIGTPVGVPEGAKPGGDPP
jgi:hypothetical protein